MVVTLFDPTGNLNNQYLDTLTGYNGGNGYSMNNSGIIAGSADTSTASQAVIYTPNGGGYTIVPLGTLAGHKYSEAYSINSSGQVVGRSIPDWGDSRAVLFDTSGAGNNIDLSPGTWGSAKCINDNGWIVGGADTGSGMHAVLFDPTGNGNNLDLGTLTGGYSGAYGINNAGQIVGQSSDGSGDFHATLFDPTGNGNNIDLNTLVELPEGWILRQASAINDSGWIVGFAEDEFRDRHAYLITPEPASLGLLGFGVFLLYRKRQK